MNKEKGVKPYKSNRVIADPRQSLFLSYYTNPKSSTFANAYRSAIKAKYSEEYAKIITADMPDWMSESLRTIQTEQMARKARRNLDKFLDMNTDNEIYSKDGDYLGNRRDAGLVRVKADVTKFVAEKLDDDFKSKKQEGVNINILNVELNDSEKDKINKTLGKIINI